MKLKSLLAFAFLSTSAFAGEYQNWIGSSALIDCKSTFENKERAIVSTIKTHIVNDGEFESISKVDIYSQVQIGNDEYRRKYTINSVKVDVLGDDEPSTTVLRPTIISGKHAKTGEKIRIEMDANQWSMEYAPADLYIGGKAQEYLKLECRVVFAG